MTIVDLPGASPVEAPETLEPAPSEPTRKRGGFGRFVLRGFFLLAVPVANTAQAQEVHVVTYHAVCDALENRLLKS